MIPLFKVYVPEGTAAKLEPVLSSGYIAEGVEVKNFEKALQVYLCNENVLTTNSCTSSLQIALRLSNVKAGDEVFTTSMTCIATNAPIATLSAIPVWVDVDPSHGMISPETLLKSIEKHPDIKVLIYVCWGGDLGPLQEIDTICKACGIKLIVDAAQAFGGRTNEFILGDGTYGDYTCFSFQAIKHITVGDGGAIAFRTNDDILRATKLKWFGPDRDGFRTANGEIDWTADVPEIGFKMHMNNIAGCIGRAQMDDDINARLFKYLVNDLRLTKALQGTLERSWKGATAAWVSTFLGDNSIGLLDFLKEKEIHASKMHVNNDIYSGFHADSVDLPGVEKFMDRHICLPCGWWVSDDNIQYIVESVKEFYA
ncbi:hypothetical protein LCGC14_1135660 [marine sediment metagenome]|uniref:Aminotransferase class V domain-containing protein n=1 Tax=marine sediment metagenome TaxID=412755 RepID=A0A0F9M4N7_9ZZZZ